ncbi:phage tail tape measure protein [Vallitalea maricola]|uniref:Uncharacterized protein n=1 Tax=Vallitalea maricola TaxID=3074433 RepID=A0ACB5UF58_9FIRM|nr:hypothetical protein AN2V17_04310 [Vallitalea sp. AN17-2]
MATKEVIDELVVQIGTDYTNFKSGLDNVNKELEKSSTRALEKLKEFDKVGKNLSLYVTAPLALLGKTSLDMSMDVTESENLFEVSMKNMADAARNFSEKLRNDLGLNAVEVRKNVATFQTMFNSMKISEEQAYKMSTSLSELSYDMASFRNLKPEEAFQKLQAGISGETEPLKRLGILIDEATVKQVAYKNGIAETGKELTQQQKVLARYAAIMEQTKDDQGDLARTLDSPTNKLRIFNEKVKEFETNIGDALIPLMKKLLDIATPIVNTFNDFGDETQSVIVQIGLLAAGVGPAILAINKLNAAFTFLMANPVVLAISGIAAVIAAIAVEAAKSKDEQEKLNQELQKTNEIREKGIAISQIEEIQKEKEELKKLVKQYNELQKVHDEIIAKAQGVDGEFNEFLLDSDALSKVTEQMRELDKEFDKIGVSYENASSRVEAYETALKEANKEKERQIELQNLRNTITNDEIATDRQLYNQQLQNTNELKKLVSQYKELTSKQQLSTSQKENLIKVSNSLRNLLGEEIVARNSQNEVIGLNITAINSEVEAIENNVNINKQAIKEKIKDEISFTNIKTNEVIKRIEVENGYLKTINKLRTPYNQKYDDPITAQVMRQSNLMLDKEKKKRESSINELDKILNQLKTKKESYKKELLNIDDINFDTKDINLKTNIDISADNTKQIDNISEANRLLQEQNKDQLEAIKDQDEALEKAYKNLQDNLKSSRKYQLELLEDEKKKRIEIVQDEIKEQEKLHKQKLEDIQEEKNKKLDAIQEEIDKIQNSAKQQDRQQELQEAKQLYELYKQSSTAEGQKKAKELAKQIRDIENQEQIDSLKQQQENIKDLAEQEENDTKKAYETKIETLKKQEEKLKSHYETLTNQVMKHYNTVEAELKNQYNTQKELINERSYVIKEQNEQMLKAVSEYAKNNEAIYTKSADDIIKLLKDKAGEYYQTGIELAKSFQEGLKKQLEITKGYETTLGGNLTIPEIPTEKTASTTNNSTNNTKNVKVTINNNGTNIFETDADIEEFSDTQATEIEKVIDR